MVILGQNMMADALNIGMGSIKSFLETSVGETIDVEQKMIHRVEAKWHKRKQTNCLVRKLMSFLKADFVPFPTCCER